MKKAQKSISELESLVRDGKFQQVSLFLKRLNAKKIPREMALPYANLARRINDFFLALRILNPIVRTENRFAKPATPLEQIEYAEILRKVGSIDEARKMLSSIDGNAFPQALLHQSFCCFSRWQYAQAIPLLKQYVSTKQDIGDYQRTVGQVNLAAALIYEKNFEEAISLLAFLREQTRQKSFHLLHGNTLELSAQLEIFQRNWSQAYNYLDEADGYLERTGMAGQLWLQKWRAIAESLQAERVLPRLETFVEKAKQAEHWETFRDTTYYIAHIARDRELLDKIYFGTPFESYRANILRQNSWYKPSSAFHFHSEKNRPRVVLDIENATLNDGTEVTPFGLASHRLLVLLSRDLFRPVPLAAVFAQLFPEECFNPRSSPTRVHQTVKRLRQRLNECCPSLVIEESEGSYRLCGSGVVSLLLPQTTPSLDSKEHQLHLLLNQMGATEFSVRDATEKLGGSISTNQRILRWAVTANKLVVTGAGPTTRYKLAG